MALFAGSNALAITLYLKPSSGPLAQERQLLPIFIILKAPYRLALNSRMLSVDIKFHRLCPVPDLV
jgi:hypothetical protein